MSLAVGSSEEHCHDRTSKQCTNGQCILKTNGGQTITLAITNPRDRAGDQTKWQFAANSVPHYAPSTWGNSRNAKANTTYEGMKGLLSSYYLWSSVHVLVPSFVYCNSFCRLPLPPSRRKRGRNSLICHPPFLSPRCIMSTTGRGWGYSAADCN